MSTIERDELEDCEQASTLFGMKVIKYDDARRIVDDFKRQLAEVTRERDEARRRAGSTQSIGVDFGLACGRHYLSVCGHVVAVEGDTQRDVQLSCQFGPAWNKEAIDCVVAKSKEQDSDLAQAREQLEQVTRERNRLSGECSHWQAGVALKQKKIDTLEQQLAAVQAEAAAMREAFAKRVSFGCHFWNGANDTYIRFNDREKSLAAKHAIGSFLQGIAGRELQDEMRRKDERIAELEAKNDELQLDLYNVDYDDFVSLKSLTEWSLMKPLPRVKDQFELNSPISIVAATIEKYRDRWRRAKRKSRTAKAALVETYRGQIDPAWFGEVKSVEPVYWKARGQSKAVFRFIDNHIQAVVAGEWQSIQESLENIERDFERCNADGSLIVKPEPVWQYRRWNNETPGYGVAIWRTSNGSAIESSFIGQEKRYWSTSSGFSSWRECVDDPNTFPCNESGERIEQPLTQAHDASETSGVPAPSADDSLVAIARELRELLREHQGGYVIHMIHELHQLLIKLRDAEGGA